MRLAVTSQDFQSVTGHAGRARRFIIFEVNDVESVLEVERLDLDETMTIHGFDLRAAHPLDDLDVLITGGAGAGFIRHLAARGVQVMGTDESDPRRAVEAFLSGYWKLANEGCNHDKSEHSCTCHG